MCGRFDNLGVNRHSRRKMCKKLNPALTAVSGILLTAVALHAEVAFSDVWPVIERRCVSCHQPGEIAPMPLTSYAEVVLATADADSQIAAMSG